MQKRQKDRREWIFLTAVKILAFSLLFKMGVTSKVFEGNMQTTDSKIQGYWFAVLVWAFVATLLIEKSARADERWIPSARHYAAVEQRLDCSVYNSVMTKMQGELAHKKELLTHFQGELKRNRAALELCAQERGLLNSVSEADEVYVAEVCGEQYDLWLTPGYRLEIVKQDIESIKHNLEIAKGHVNGRCPNRLKPS